MAMWFKSKEKEEEEKKLFTESWMKEWFKSINSSKGFKQKGKNWSVPLILKFDPLPNAFQKKGVTGIYINLTYGECEELRYSKKNDEATCDVILTADEHTWIHLMEKGTSPTSMIMDKRLSLEKGSLILLSTHNKAAKELLKTAPTLNFELDRSRENLKQNSRTHFATTSTGLNMKSLPMQLFKKAKSQESWNFFKVDYTQDCKDWAKLNKTKKKIITHFLSLVIACEEASVVEHLPLVQVGAQNFEDQMYLTSLLWEESKHIDFCSEYLKYVVKPKQDLELFHGPHFKSFLYNQLPHITGLLKNNSSLLAQIKTFAILNVIVKQTLIKTSCSTLKNLIIEQDILPGLQKGILAIEKEELRHKTFASYFINRIISKNRDLKEPLKTELNERLYDVTNIIQEIPDYYQEIPSKGLKRKTLINNTIKEFQNGISVLNF